MENTLDELFYNFYVILLLLMLLSAVLMAQCLPFCKLSISPLSTLKRVKFLVLPRLTLNDEFNSFSGFFSLSGPPV